jgi:hypothetical protein
VWANSKNVSWRVVANFVVSLRGVPFCVMDSICSCVMNPAWMAKHFHSLSLILLYHPLDGSLTGPIMATPANLPSGTVGWTTPPTNYPTETILAPRNAKYAQRSPHVHKTHNIQITSSNNTIGEYIPRIWLPGHLPRQDQTRNYPKHSRDCILLIFRHNANPPK